jgi:ubiquinone/menaquinone biosynthesis C-methylase UbiE
MTTETYIIRGGVEGFDRLKVLVRVMHPTTAALFDRVGVKAGMRCLDVGCGSGDVAFELARRVGPEGHVVGADLDEVKLELAQRDIDERGLRNVELRKGDVSELSAEPEFDLIYARFLLTHLRDPAAALASWRRTLRAGGVIVVEDMDAIGMVSYPPVPAFEKMVDLYTKSAERRGGDPNIGLRLPGMLAAAGLVDVEMNLVQPAATTGEAKIIPLLTAQNIADVVLGEELATQEEFDAMLAGLSEAGNDSHTLLSLPRVTQAWGRQPGRAVSD